MFFFVSLRESANRPGTIEPDILPPSSAVSTHSSTGLLPTSTSTSTAKDRATRWSASFQEWITRWDISDRPGMFRKTVCILAMCLHVPMNVLSIMSYGLSLWLFFGIVVSVLNLIGVGVSLWKLDEMRGARLIYNSIWKRHNFDYVILALFVIYGFSFGMFVFAKLTYWGWIRFLRIIWPCLAVTDIFCFVTGWFATWRDVSIAPLG